MSEVSPNSSERLTPREFDHRGAERHATPDTSRGIATDISDTVANGDQRPRHTGRRPYPRNLPHPPSVEGARWIPLTQGRFALIDEADYPVVSPFLWQFKRHWHDEGYAFRSCTNKKTGRHTTISLHLFLWREWGLPDCKNIDHENRNGLDCRRQNLRASTCSQNLANQPAHRDNKTGFKGVSRSGGRWKATIGFQGKPIWLGYFANPETAALAYDKAAAQLFGDFARLNFPATARVAAIGGAP